MSQTTNDISYRLAQRDDADEILDFVKRMRFTPRRKDTWLALDMGAATAWLGSRLVGAIPFEPRDLKIFAGTIRAIHESTVAVDPDFQRHGIGSAMQELIFSERPCHAEWATVYREHPESGAYRWYVRSGFKVQASVTSFVLASPDEHGQSSGSYVAYSVDDPSIDWSCIEALRMSWFSHLDGGFVVPRSRPLREWLRIHPYGTRYRFYILCVGYEDRFADAYAVLAVGRLHSETDRVDIFEFVPGESEPHFAERLLTSIVAFARRNDYRPVRWAMSEQSPMRELASRARFTPVWPFDVLMRPLGDQAQISLAHWHYHSIDYI